MTGRKKLGSFWFPAEESHFTLCRNVDDYQRPQRDFALRLVTDRSLCIDVGAHVGIFSRHFANHFDRVLAFEPIENIRDLLRDNVPENVSIDSRAVSDFSGKVKLLQLSTTNSGCSYVVSDDRVFRPREPIGGDTVVEADVVRIDDLGIDRVGLIKVDVQGCDHLVLRGARETIYSCKPVVMVEEKPVGGPTGPTDHIDDTRSLMKDLGYKNSQRVGAERIYWP